MEDSSELLTHTHTTIHQCKLLYNIINFNPKKFSKKVLKILPVHDFSEKIEKKLRKLQKIFQPFHTKLVNKKN